MISMSLIPFEGILTDEEEKKSIVRDLGDKNVSLDFKFLSSNSALFGNFWV